VINNGNCNNRSTESVERPCGSAGSMSRVYRRTMCNKEVIKGVIFDRMNREGEQRRYSLRPFGCCGLGA
jgi:hypothetical protein